MDKLVPLADRSHLFWFIVGLIGVAGIAVADVLTGAELSFSLFYLIPIVLVTWFSGRNFGLVVGIVSATAWFTADVLAGHTYSSPIIRYWNSAVRLGYFVMVIYLIPTLQALRREKVVSRIDELTGAANRRSFFEVAHVELQRLQRYKHPFTMVYIDLDNFKYVNDQWGHEVGDRLLRVVVQLIKQHLRKTDFVARFGGDEFVLLLPETDEAAAHIIVSKLRSALLDGMHHYNWPVNFSIGALTCHDAYRSIDELIRDTDVLMYSVKKNGKGGIAYAVHSD